MYIYIYIYIYIIIFELCIIRASLQPTLKMTTDNDVAGSSSDVESIAYK